MNILSFVQQAINDAFLFFRWQDVVEIALLSTAMYYISVWLRQDRYHNLLGYFYVYCLTGLTAHYCSMSTITYCMIISMPMVCMLFILIHQQTLQKNFITLRNAAPRATTPGDWIELLVRSALIAINNNKTFLCIIELHDSLQEHLHADVSLQAPLNESVLSLIIQSHTFNDQQLLWVTSRATVAGFNASWRIPEESQWVDPSVQQVELWKQEALCATQHVDALVVQVDPITRTFTLISQGKMIEHISSAAITAHIKKYIAHAAIQGDVHGTQSTRNSFAQHHS